MMISCTTWISRTNDSRSRWMVSTEGWRINQIYISRNGHWMVYGELSAKLYLHCWCTGDIDDFIKWENKNVYGNISNISKHDDMVWTYISDTLISPSCLCSLKSTWIMINMNDFNRIMKITWCMYNQERQQMFVTTQVFFLFLILGVYDTWYSLRICPGSFEEHFGIINSKILSMPFIWTWVISIIWHGNLIYKPGYHALVGPWLPYLPISLETPPVCRVSLHNIQPSQVAVHIYQKIALGRFVKGPVQNYIFIANALHMWCTLSFCVWP